MKVLISIILLISVFGKTNNFDIGPPEIHAVCKVTLKDGKTIEGFITFASLNIKYKPHGFCLINSDGRKKLILYGFKFKISDLNRYNINRSGTSKLYYVKNLNNGSKSDSKYDKGNQVLTITNTEVEKYKLLDEMIMYKKLPLDLFLHRFVDEKDSGKFTISVNKIKSVVFLKKPSQNSLEIIKKARFRQSTEEAKVGYWTDYQQPVWYHEVINDKNKMKYLSEYF